MPKIISFFGEKSAVFTDLNAKAVRYANQNGLEYDPNVSRRRYFTSRNIEEGKSPNLAATAKFANSWDRLFFISYPIYKIISV